MISAHLISSGVNESTSQEGAVSELNEKATDRVAPSPASPPDDLVKDLGAEVSDEAQNTVKGGRADIFAKLGDIKGESLY